MIPFLSTQLDRGSGSSNQEVRPIVPSMFEPTLPVSEVGTEESFSPPLDPTLSPAAVVPSSEGRRTISAERDREGVTNRPRNPHDIVPSPLTELPHGYPVERPPVIAPLARPQSPATAFDPPPSRFMTPPVVDLGPPVQSPAPSLVIGAVRTTTSDRPITNKTHGDSPAVQSLADQVAGLTRQMGTLSSTPRTPPVISPIISSSRATLKTERTEPTSGIPKSHSGESHSPMGMNPRQAIPHIEPGPAAVSSPMVTVSIGRIEFRNTRRSDSALPPATSPQRPASRVVSLEDYLRQRSAGAP